MNRDPGERFSTEVDVNYLLNTQGSALSARSQGLSRRRFLKATSTLGVVSLVWMCETAADLEARRLPQARPVARCDSQGCELRPRSDKRDS